MYRILDRIVSCAIDQLAADGEADHVHRERRGLALDPVCHLTRRRQEVFVLVGGEGVEMQLGREPVHPVHGALLVSGVDRASVTPGMLLNPRRPLRLGVEPGGLLRRR